MARTQRPVIHSRCSEQFRGSVWKRVHVTVRKLDTERRYNKVDAKTIRASVTILPIAAITIIVPTFVKRTKRKLSGKITCLWRSFFSLTNQIKKKICRTLKTHRKKKKNNQKIFCEECMEIKMGKGKIYL